MEENESVSFMNPFDLFVSECMDEDVEVRLNSIKKLRTVAAALSTDRIKNELIPYLDTLTEGIYNDDEVLLNLAEQLGNFLPLIGGSENASLILNILEKLASAEENVVREKAVESLKFIANDLDTSILENIFVPMILRLVDSEWFTPKSSAAALLSICYTKVSDEIRTNLRNVYRILCQDESPLVRRAAAARLVEFVKVLELDNLRNEFIPVFDNFAQDDQDSIRVLSIDVGISIASRLQPKEIEDFILTTLTGLCGDSSWRVRYQVANQITSMQLALGQELTRKHLITIYQNLVHDEEPEVREATARHVVKFCENLQRGFKENGGEGVDPTIINQIFPLIEYLDQDVHTDVKEALSAVITSLTYLLGEENTRKLLLPLITSSLLKDSPKVRKNIIANLNNIISVIGISDIADTVLKIVIDLVDNSASMWRTRRNLIVTINYIAKHSGKEYFDKHLKSLYKKLLSDGVYAVRKTAPLILPVLAKHFGISWAIESLVPEFLSFVDHKHYLYRYVCLYCIDELVSPTLETLKYEGAITERRLKLLYGQENPPNNISAILDALSELTGSLGDKLKEEWIQEALKILEEDDIADDNIEKYVEGTIEMFIKDNNVNILQVSEEELELKKNSDIYLVGVLELIQNKFLSVLEKLAQDPIPNIRHKVARTLIKIMQFNDSLRKELGNEDAPPKVETAPPEIVLQQEESKITSQESNERKDSDKEEADEKNVAENDLQEEKSLESELVEMLEQKLHSEAQD